MFDLVFLAAMLGLFALGGLFVRAIERL
ncbi:protein of unknown function [Magnetospirillum gryphiswaldense MSR-1 v2]|uniref:Potassium-transporting ATPase n=1 Tax=Magnetospirillum gryphiswaldense (strain DSM 6361 / JCM 21280 / NBRC 15271 / MSR-1) TaxID=431944 RepID=V6F0X9_MAGGM|nr:protein of unknown function [Magnetospirillum gryphiswaldense MSR-1 v2]